MTEKRFTIDKKGGVFYLFDNGNLIPIYDGQPICDLLNELAEENSKLHIQNDFLKDENHHMRDLVNENEQLKQQLELYQELYPTGKWITELTTEELEKELSENEL